MDAIVSKHEATVLVQGEFLKVVAKVPGFFMGDNEKLVMEAKFMLPGEQTIHAYPRSKKPTSIRTGEKLGVFIPLAAIFPPVEKMVSTFTPPPPAAVEQEKVEAVTPSVDATPEPAVIEDKPVKKDWRSLPRRKK
jgi:hypothetical protein